MKTKFLVSVSDEESEPIIEFEVPFKLDIGTVVIKDTCTDEGSLDIEATIESYMYFVETDTFLMYATAYDFEDWMRKRIGE